MQPGPGNPDTQMPETLLVSEQAGGEPETQKPAVSVQPVVDGQVDEPLVEQKEPEHQKPPSVTALPVPMREDEEVKAKALVLALAAQMATELPPVTPVQPPQSASQDVPPVEVEKGHSLHASPGFPSAQAIFPTPTAPENASAAGADAPTPLAVPVKTEPEPQMPAPATPPEKVTFLFSDNEASDNEGSGSVNKSQEASSPAAAVAAEVAQVPRLALTPQPQQDAAEDLSHLCSCCRKSPRVDRHIYGVGCKRGLNNVTNAAKAKSNDPRLAKWPEVRKAGGAPLNSLIMSYRQQNDTSVSKQGKQRNTFDICTEMEDLIVAQSVETGVRLVYMHYERWLRLAQTDHMMTVAQADADWQNTKASMPLAKQKTRNGHLFLPMPAEDYIDGKNTVAHEKRLRMAGKPQKEPDLDKAKERLFSGGLGLGDAAFKNVGGAELKIASDNNESFVLSPEKMLGVASSADMAVPAANVKNKKAAAGGSGGDGASETGEGAGTGKKRKRYDLAAAQNRNRSTFVDSMYKMMAMMNDALKEAKTVVLDHAGKDEYAGYMKTLEQRMTLVVFLVVDVPMPRLKQAKSQVETLNAFPRKFMEESLGEECQAKIFEVNDLLFKYRALIQAHQKLPEAEQAQCTELREHIINDFEVLMPEVDYNCITHAMRHDMGKLHRRVILGLAVQDLLASMDSCPVEGSEIPSLLPMVISQEELLETLASQQDEDSQCLVRLQCVYLPS